MSSKNIGITERDANIVLILFFLVSYIIIMVASPSQFCQFSYFASPSCYLSYIGSTINSAFEKIQETYPPHNTSDYYVNLSIFVEDMIYPGYGVNKEKDSIIVNIQIDLSLINGSDVALKNSSRIQLTIYALSRENENYPYYSNRYSLLPYAEFYSLIDFLIEPTRIDKNTSKITVRMMNISRIDISNIYINGKKVRPNMLKNFKILSIHVENNKNLLKNIVIIYKKNGDINKKMYNNLFNLNLIFYPTNISNTYYIDLIFYILYNNSSRVIYTVYLLSNISLFLLVPYIFILHKVILRKNSTGEFLAYISVAVAYIVLIFSLGYRGDEYQSSNYNIYLFFLFYALQNIGSFAVVYLVYVIFTSLEPSLLLLKGYKYNNLLMIMIYLLLLLLNIYLVNIYRVNAIEFYHWVFGKFDWPVFQITYTDIFLIVVIINYYIKIYRSNP